MDSAQPLVVTRQTLADGLYDYLRHAGHKISRQTAADAVYDMLCFVETALIHGGEVKLHNIGTMRTVYPARTTKTNLPATKGKECVFRPTVKFKASTALRRDIRPKKEG
jgi:nucleoid DNA-binding protein